MGRKGGSKRQASLDARKQIQKVRGEYFELSDGEDDDDVVEVTETPAKKYKISSRKSDGERNVLRIVLDAEPTLDLDVWTDDLSPAQLQSRKEAQTARDSIQSIVDKIVKENEGRLVANSTPLTVVELNTFLQNEAAKKAQLAAATQSAPPVARGPGGRPGGMRRILPNTQAPPTNPPALTLVVDPKKAAAAAGKGGNNVGIQLARRIEAPVPKKKAFLKGYTAPPTTTTTTLNATAAPAMIPIIRTDLPPLPAQPVVTPLTFTTTATTKRIGNIVDLTSEDAAKTTAPSADSKEVAFNKLQGKTFPSLVVVARPSLNISEEISANQNQNRASLDRKVKRLLVFPPAQFAEYLIQQGLVKSEHYCQTHPAVKLKLGMYSDASRFPNSGGYIWISECCPPKFLSVFHESLFEGTQLPSTNFKLIYHWACQTNVQNVLQWVKVENVYLKGLYTWLRGICTVALHTHFPTLGGMGCMVEVGVISLGTTTHDGANRHVKVEVLGVLETKTKRLMLRAVDPNEVDVGKSAKKRFTKILEPLLEWVSPESTLVIDMTIEKQALQAMGFKDVIRNGSNGASNQTIMDYLRRIVPRMFQNTLSLLSRQIIQQFLDELVWREMFGNNAYDAFHSIQKHISEQTRVNTGFSFFNRLNKVAANPFRRWSIAGYLKNTTGRTPARKPMKQYGSAPGVQTSAASAANTLLQQKQQQQSNEIVVPRTLLNNNVLMNPRVAQIPKQLTPLESYYYGSIECNPVVKEVELSVQCPTCEIVHTSNTDLMLHLFKHVSGADYFCKYCLMDCGSKHNLYTHLELKHATETKAGRFFNCLICHDKFNSVVVLGKHMSIEHSPSELPYHCGDCQYKSSSHKSIIDHFYKKHKNQPLLQCPFCLSMTNIDNVDVPMWQEVTNYLKHLNSHVKKGKNPKGAVKKCARCDLQFLTKEEFDAHGERHVCYKLEANFKAYIDSKNIYMVPKSLRDPELKDPKTSRQEYVQQCSITFSIPEDCRCKECGKQISKDVHFKDVMFCMKADCKYQTMCKTAMLSHKVMCSLYSKKQQDHPLEFELFCVCGFSSMDGNAMAAHLAICERKSAYPSAEAAAKASVTPGMLDVLGLIRKDDSKDPEEIKPVKTRPEPRRRKRKWCVTDLSDNEEDVDDPDYNTSDEEFRPTVKRRRRPAASKVVNDSPPVLTKEVPTTTTSTKRPSVEGKENENADPASAQEAPQEENAIATDALELLDDTAGNNGDAPDLELNDKIEDATNAVDT